MFESKYSKLLTVLLIVGIVLIVAILGTTGVIIMQNGKAKQEAENAVNDFQNSIKEDKDDKNEEVSKNNTILNEIVPIIKPENVIVDNTSDEEENKQTYKGFVMVGTIEIPAIDFSSPVLEDVSADAIDEAVAIYYGPGLNEVGVTTIAGHNYRDGRFFANNKKLVAGDKIYITDESKQKITYEIYKIYTTSPEDESHLEYDTQGKREIALSTCTDDSQSRLIILAKER